MTYAFIILYLVAFQVGHLQQTVEGKCTSRTWSQVYAQNSHAAGVVCLLLKIPKPGHTIAWQQSLGCEMEYFTNQAKKKITHSKVSTSITFADTPSNAVPRLVCKRVFPYCSVTQAFWIVLRRHTQEGKFWSSQLLSAWSWKIWIASSGPCNYMAMILIHASGTHGHLHTSLLRRFFTQNNNQQQTSQFQNFRQSLHQ